MIMIFGTLVLNDISRPFFYCFEIFIFWAVRGLKGKSKAKNENNNYISHVSYLWNSRGDDMIFGTLM